MSCIKILLSNLLGIIDIQLDDFIIENLLEVKLYGGLPKLKQLVEAGIVPAFVYVDLNKKENGKI